MQDPDIGFTSQRGSWSHAVVLVPYVVAQDVVQLLATHWHELYDPQPVWVGMVHDGVHVDVTVLYVHSALLLQLVWVAN